jgi:hypothetical protein
MLKGCGGIIAIALFLFGCFYGGISVMMTDKKI